MNLATPSCLVSHRRKVLLRWIDRVVEVGCTYFHLRVRVRVRGGCTYFHHLFVLLQLPLCLIPTLVRDVVCQRGCTWSCHCRGKGGGGREREGLSRQQEQPPGRRGRTREDMWRVVADGGSPVERWACLGATEGSLRTSGEQECLRGRLEPADQNGGKQAVRGLWDEGGGRANMCDAVRTPPLFQYCDIGFRHPLWLFTVTSFTSVVCMIQLSQKTRFSCEAMPSQPFVPRSLRCGSDNSPLLLDLITD
jgi:hypothetical protein